MPRLSIAIHASGSTDFETADEATVEAVREAIADLVGGHHATQLIGAHEMADILRRVGRKHWASALAGMEEPHMVTVQLHVA